MHTRISFQLVLTSFSFEPEIDLKALVQCLLPLVQDCSQSTTAAQGNLIAIHLKILEQHDGIAQKHGGMIEQHGGITQEHGGIGSGA
ncbi:MAG: hypothetical protein HC840_27895 [Leptolyngbyaceae cyanobacterium RM2_2_4]|nr:hypothetical protein [Leptolyngbyaceae cyanobacterium RM2_2_4]